MNRLEEERRRLGLRKAEVARRANMSRSHYGRVERGESSLSYEAAKRLAAVFNRRVSEVQLMELSRAEAQEAVAA